MKIPTQHKRHNTTCLLCYIVDSRDNETLYPRKQLARYPRKEALFRDAPPLILLTVFSTFFHITLLPVISDLFGPAGHVSFLAFIFAQLSTRLAHPPVGCFHDHSIIIVALLVIIICMSPYNITSSTWHILSRRLKLHWLAVSIRIVGIIALVELYDNWSLLLFYF